MTTTLARVQGVSTVSLLLFFSISASSKVSTEEILCVRPHAITIDAGIALQLRELKERSEKLGRLDGIFITTLITRPPQEPEPVSTRRAKNVLKQLRSIGISHDQASLDFFRSDRVAPEECRRNQVAVQVQLLFQEPAYLRAPPTK